LIGVYEAVEQKAEHITAVFYNPNIAPAEEYLKRRDACRNYCLQQGISFTEIEAGFDDWAQVTETAQSSDLRCQACYSLRLNSVARWAAENGADSFATTLSISPWQNLEAINKAGAEAAKNFPSLHFASHDFRNYYRKAQKTARDLGIYCQNYCGCLPNKAEAEKQRAARRNATKTKKELDT
jgi:predicted adenine nucleotide alpha hydrolase (AANH) superfamily ATPase